MFIKTSHRRAYVPEWSKRRPRADNLSYAISTIRLGFSEMADALWSFVNKDFPGPCSEDSVLAAEWLSLFIGDKDLTDHSPLFPLGIAPQWGRLKEMGLFKERDVGRGYTTLGMTRSTWDLLFLAAVTPQSLTGLRAVRDAGWASSNEPVPLSVVTRAMGQSLLSEGLPGPIPYELVLAGLHMAGQKIRFLPNDAEPLIYVEVPAQPGDGDEMERDLPSLLDAGWMSAIPEGAVTDIGLDGHHEFETTHFHILNAATLLARVDRGFVPDWAPLGVADVEALQSSDDLRIVNIPFQPEDAASGLSRLAKSGRIRPDQLILSPPDRVIPASRSRGKPKAVPPRPETTFANIMTIMAEGWFKELAEHQENSHSFSNRPLFPYDGVARGAELMRILSLDGFSLSQARLRVERLMDPDEFESLISTHVDRDEKVEINVLLHMRRGNIGDPLSRFWQSLCLMNLDRSVEEIGVEDYSSSSGNSRITRLKIEGRLFMSERLPVMNMLSLAEQAGCKGFVSVGESFIGSELVPGSLIRRTQTLSLTCVDVANASTLSNDLLGRFDRAQDDMAGPSGLNL